MRSSRTLSALSAISILAIGFSAACSPPVVEGNDSGTSDVQTQTDTNSSTDVSTTPNDATINDSGTTPTDSGTTPTDSGTTPADSGTTPTDSGTSGDSGGMACGDLATGEDCAMCCADAQPDALQELQQGIIDQCACMPSAPCSSQCTDLCTGAAPSMTCFSCLQGQITMGTACVQSAVTTCSAAPTCQPYIDCAQTCPTT